MALSHQPLTPEAKTMPNNKTPVEKDQPADIKAKYV
jgi:hypothetical protein